MSKKEMEEKNIKTLSKNLKEALEEFKNSELSEEALGKHLSNKMIQNAEIQWDEYKKASGNKFEQKVSPYEIEKYLPRL